MVIEVKKEYRLKVNIPTRYGIAEKGTIVNKIDNLIVMKGIDIVRL